MTDLSKVNFDLPGDPKSNQAILAPSSTNDLLFYLGCTGWSMPEWKEKWYPAKAKTDAFAQHYGQQFNTIEFNTTHYRIPTPAQVSKWIDKVPDDFKFCPKIPQTISHHQSLALHSNALDLFLYSLEAFGTKLGCSFIQLPPHFGLDKIDILAKFLARWPDHLSLAVEVRHESWFAATEATESFIQLLHRHNVASVITDVAGRRDVLHGQLSNKKAMIRFVGNGLLPSDYKRIDDWCVRIKQWQSMGLEEIYFFSHQPDNILAPDMALYIYEKLANQANIQVRGPVLVQAEEDAQLKLF